MLSLGQSALIFMGFGISFCICLELYDYFVAKIKEAYHAGENIPIPDPAQVAFNTANRAGSYVERCITFSALKVEPSSKLVFEDCPIARARYPAFSVFAKRRHGDAFLFV